MEHLSEIVYEEIFEVEEKFVNHRHNREVVNSARSIRETISAVSQNVLQVRTFVTCQEHVRSIRLLAMRNRMKRGKARYFLQQRFPGKRRHRLR